MGQRLGIAGRCSAIPGVLLFDEPVNGSTPTGSAGCASCCGAGRGGAHRLCLEPPDERDGHDRGPGRRHRQGSAHRRDADRGVHVPELAALRPGALTAARPAASGASRKRGHRSSTRTRRSLSVHGLDAEKIGELALPRVDRALMSSRRRPPPSRRPSSNRPKATSSTAVDHAPTQTKGVSSMTRQHRRPRSAATLGRSAAGHYGFGGVLARSGPSSCPSARRCGPCSSPRSSASASARS